MTPPAALLTVTWTAPERAPVHLSREKRLARNKAAPTTANHFATIALKARTAEGVINLAAIPELRQITERGFRRIETPPKPEPAEKGLRARPAQEDTAPYQQALAALFLLILTREAPELVAAIRDNKVKRVALKGAESPDEKAAATTAANKKLQEMIDALAPFLKRKIAFITEAKLPAIREALTAAQALDRSTIKKADRAMTHQLRTTIDQVASKIRQAEECLQATKAAAARKIAAPARREEPARPAAATPTRSAAPTKPAAPARPVKEPEAPISKDAKFKVSDGQIFAQIGSAAGLAFSGLLTYLGAAEVPGLALSAATAMTLGLVGIAVCVLIFIVARISIVVSRHRFENQQGVGIIKIWLPEGEKQATLRKELIACGLGRGIHASYDDWDRKWNVPGINLNDLANLLRQLFDLHIGYQLGIKEQEENLVVFMSGTSYRDISKDCITLKRL